MMRHGKFAFRYDNIAHWSSRKRVIVILLVCIISVAISYLLSVDLFYRQLQNSRVEENALKKNVAQLQRQLGQMPAYKKQLQQLKRTTQIFSDDLPNDSTLPAMLAAITTLAKSAGLHMQSLQPLPVKKQRFFSEVPLKIQAQGNFQQIIHFVNALAQSRNHALLDDFKLSKSEAKGVQSLLDFDFTVNMIFLTVPLQHDIISEKPAR